MRLLALMLCLVCRPLPAAELYFGLLHGHTSFSDGSGTPHDAFVMARSAGLDFMAITEHNHHQAAGSDGIFLTRALYGDLAQFANRHTVDGQFVAIFGQEVSTISSGNHFNIFYANDICDIPHGDFKALYEAWLPAHPEVPFIQFNHPDFRKDQRSSTPANQRNNDYGIDGYDSFEELVAASGKYVALIELIIGPAFSEATNKLHQQGMVRPATYGGKVHRYRQDGTATKNVEDEASRAWNFFTALYYKAGGVPWRLIRSSSDFDTCFVGVSYFHQIDDDSIQASVAQVFNERGEGVVVRGGQVLVQKDDRTMHMDQDVSASLLRNALSLYKREHRNLPARVVCHKSSYFDEAENSGFQSVVDDMGIDQIDLVSLRKSSVRFFRNRPYPPLRGTAIELEAKTWLLYTQGSVDFYRSYPGMHIPRAIEVRFDQTDRRPEPLLEEILALSKMNWNSTRFVNAEPITLAAARTVGNILRYVADDVTIQPRYSHYM